MRRAALLSVTLCALGCQEPKDAGAGQTARATSALTELTLLWTGNVAGEVEPCG